MSQCLFLFIYNPQSPVSADCVNMDVRPNSGVWLAKANMAKAN